MALQTYGVKVFQRHVQGLPASNKKPSQKGGFLSIGKMYTYLVFLKFG
jgi:hypothetical protein